MYCSSCIGRQILLPLSHPGSSAAGGTESAYCPAVLELNLGVAESVHGGYQLGEGSCLEKGVDSLQLNGL